MAESSREMFAPFKGPDDVDCPPQGWATHVQLFVSAGFGYYLGMSTGDMGGGGTAVAPAQNGTSAAATTANPALTAEVKTPYGKIVATGSVAGFCCCLGAMLWLSVEDKAAQSWQHMVLLAFVAGVLGATLVAFHVQGLLREELKRQRDENDRMASQKAKLEKDLLAARISSGVHEKVAADRKEKSDRQRRTRKRNQKQAKKQGS